MATTYFVFRRSPDGHVDAIASQSRQRAEVRLAPHTAGGTNWSYEILLETADWSAARERIGRERAAAVNAQPASDRPDDLKSFEGMA